MDKEEIRKIDFSKEADILKVMGHAVRLKIVAGLIKSECCVKDIRECLDLPQPVISQHLSILRNRGIVKAKRDGNRINYQVISPVVKKLVNTCMEEKKEGRS